MAGETWLNDDGEVILDDDGNEIVCDECPCVGPAPCTTCPDVGTVCCLTYDITFNDPTGNVITVRSNGTAMNDTWEWDGNAESYYPLNNGSAYLQCFDGLWVLGMYVQNSDGDVADVVFHATGIEEEGCCPPTDPDAWTLVEATDVSTLEDAPWAYNLVFNSITTSDCPA